MKELREMCWIKVSGTILLAIVTLLFVNACGVDDGLGQIGQTEESFVFTVSQPTNLTVVTAETREDQIVLSWEDQAVDEDGYEVFRSEDDVTYLQIDTLPSGGGTLNYTDTGLNPSTIYYYYVQAYRGTYNLSYESNRVSEITDPAPLLAPDAPTINSVDPHRFSADVSWVPGSGGGGGDVTSFGVAVTLQGGTPASWITLPSSQTTYTFDGLTESTTYDFHVQASNSAGDTSAVPFTSTTDDPPLAAPDAPTGFNAAAASGTTATLTWTDNATNEDNYVVVQDGTDVVTLGANTTSYTRSGLTSGASYTFSVRAVNAAGSAVSNSDSVTLPTVPNAPTKYSVSVERLGAVARWTDNANNETGFKLYVYDGPCPDPRFPIKLLWVLFDTVGPDKDFAPSETSYVVSTGIVPPRGSSYCTQVRAYNLAGTRASNNYQIDN